MIERVLGADCGQPMLIRVKFAMRVKERQLMQRKDRRQNLCNFLLFSEQANM